MTAQAAADPAGRGSRRMRRCAALGVVVVGTVVAAAFGLGLALGTSPGPVQVLLVAEAARGGAARGLRTMLAANATFGGEDGRDLYITASGGLYRLRVQVPGIGPAVNPRTSTMMSRR